MELDFELDINSGDDFTGSYGRNCLRDLIQKDRDLLERSVPLGFSSQCYCPLEDSSERMVKVELNRHSQLAGARDRWICRMSHGLIDFALDPDLRQREDVMSTDNIARGLKTLVFFAQGNPAPDHQVLLADEVTERLWRSGLSCEESSEPLSIGLLPGVEKSKQSMDGIVAANQGAGVPRASGATAK